MEVNPTYVDGFNSEFQTGLLMNLLRLQGLGHLTTLRHQVKCHGFVGPLCLLLCLYSGSLQKASFSPLKFSAQLG